MTQNQAMGKLGFFIRSQAFDFILTLIVSTSLVFTISYGFNSASELRGNAVLEAALCALMLAPLYLGAWSKRALPFAIAGEVAMAVGVVLLVSALSPEQVDMFVNGAVNDVDENYAVFGYVVVAVPVIVFLLSRRMAAAVVLFFAGALSCAVIQFLYRDWLTSQPGMIAALACYLGCGALVIYESYRHSSYQAQLLKRPRFAGAFASSLAISGFCLAVGIAVFFGAIAALGLSTPDVRPFNDYFQRPTVEYMGVYAPQQIDDPDQTTDQTNDEDEQTNQDNEGGDSEDDTEEGQSAPNNAVSSLLSAFDPDNWYEQYQNISYQLPIPLGVLLALLPILALVAAIVWRKTLRKRRLRRIEQHALADRAILLYDFAVKRFGLLGIEKAPNLTPLEFALSNGARLATFKRNDAQVDFLNVTLIYQRAAYGSGDVSEQDYRKLRSFYEAFFANARSEVGAAKWLWKFWRI